MNIAREAVPYVVGALEGIGIGALLSAYIVPAREGVSNVLSNPVFYAMAVGLGATVLGSVNRFVYVCFDRPERPEAAPYISSPDSAQTEDRTAGRKRYAGSDNKWGGEITLPKI